MFTGKWGQLNYHVNKNHASEFFPTVSVGKLTGVLGFQEREEARKTGVAELDLVSRGYFGVTPGGAIPAGLKLTVKARHFDDEAKAAIEAAGGVCVSLAKEE